MNSGRRWVPVLIAALATAPYVGSCARTQAASTISVEGPWAAEFEVAYQLADSEFVREILRDGEITTGEYAESRERVQDCLAEAGFPGEWIQNQFGGWNWTISSELHGTEHDAASLRCSDEWMGGVGGLYEDISANPNNEDPNSLVAQCLVRNGLVPEGFTGHDWVEFLEGSAVDLGGCYPDPNNPDSIICPADVAPADDVLPGGTSVNSPGVLNCQFNPLADVG